MFSGNVPEMARINGHIIELKLTNVTEMQEVLYCCTSNRRQACTGVSFRDL